MRTKKKMLAVAAAFALATGAGIYAATLPASAATGPAVLPMSVTNSTGRGDAVYLYVIGVQLSSGRLGYVNQGGTFTAWSGGQLPPSERRRKPFLGRWAWRYSRPRS